MAAPRAMDLTTGKLKEEKQGNGSERKRGPGRPKGTTNKSRDTSLRARLEGTFERIADALENRGDQELGQAFREDGKAMAGGLVSLTGRVKILRNPLLVLLSLVEPVLAFGRVFRIIAFRVALARATRAQEQPETDNSDQSFDFAEPAPAT